MSLLNASIAYLTGDFYLSPELQCFWMAFQGCVAVRSGPNRDGSMRWFHAFMTSTVTAYAGASFAGMWMGRPTSMLSNDMNFASCVIAFVICNYLPYDVGYRAGRTLPIVLITTAFAQLFRASGLVKFCGIGHDAFRYDAGGGSIDYYPTPVVGPILLATMLGNMGGFFSSGFHGHLRGGMPWAFQNGIFCATFYHLYVNDEGGFVGVYLRRALGDIPELLGVDGRTFAFASVSAFMHVVGILQLPEFLGPDFTPFDVRGAMRLVGRLVPTSEVDPGTGFPTARPPPIVGGMGKENGKEENGAAEEEKEENSRGREVGEKDKDL